MTRETVRAARMKSELLTTRVPSWAAAPSVSAATVSVMGRKLKPPSPTLHPLVEGVLLAGGRGGDQEQDVAVVQRRVVLAQVGDRMRQLRVGDVVSTSQADARVVEP